MNYRIGIDLGGTSIKAGIVDENYQLLSKVSCGTAMPRPNKDILDDIARMALLAAEKAGVSMDEVLYAGIGSPGNCNAATGFIEYSCNLDFVKLPMKQEMESRLHKPVFVQNDANAAAYGELLCGAAKGCQSSVCVTLGTGIGSGIIIDGHIYNGFNFAGAELGHIVIKRHGLPCKCGRRGCWEQYASATALVRQTKEAMADSPNSLLWQFAPTLDEVDGRTVFNAMRAGDAVATTVVEHYIHYLSCGVVNIINIFQPEVLCFGGGIAGEGETLLAPVRLYVARERYSKFSHHQTRLEIAQLKNNAGLIGAAFLGEIAEG